jgi:hypothetical protein
LRRGRVGIVVSSYKKQVIVVVDFGRFKVRHGGNTAPDFSEDW